MSKVPSGKRASKAGARVRTVEDDLADAEEVAEAIRRYKALGFPAARVLELASPVGAYRPPRRGQRAGVVAELLEEAEGLLDVLDAKLTTIVPWMTVRLDKQLTEQVNADRAEAIAKGLVTVEELKALAHVPMMVPLVRTPRGAVPATKANDEERRFEVARSMLGLLAHCGLVHASDEAVAELARRLVRLESRDRSETLLRWALEAAGVDAKTAGKWVDDAATHKAKRSSMNSP